MRVHCPATQLKYGNWVRGILTWVFFSLPGLWIMSCQVSQKQTKQTKNPTHFCDFSLSHASQVPNTACNQVYVRHSAFGQLTSLSFQIQNCQSGLNCAFFVTIPSHQEKKISSIKNHWNSFLNISTSQWQISPALAQKLKVWEGHCLLYPLLCQIRHKLQGFQWRPSCI